MHTEWALDRRVAILKPAGRLVGGEQTDAVATAAKGLAEAGNRALIVDLEDVEHVSSIGLGAFTQIVITYSRVNGSVKVCNPNARVRQLFDIVKFYGLFVYHDSQRAAVEAFANELTSKA